MAAKEAKSEKPWNPPKSGASGPIAGSHREYTKAELPQNGTGFAIADAEYSTPAVSQAELILSEILAELKAIRTLLQANSAV